MDVEIFLASTEDCATDCYFFKLQENTPTPEELFISSVYPLQSLSQNLIRFRSSCLSKLDFNSFSALQILRIFFLQLQKICD